MIFGTKAHHLLDVKSQPSPPVSGEEATFLCQCHSHLFNYFSPIALDKALPLGSLFTQNGWVSTSISCRRETGGSRWPWMRYCKFWRLICQVTGLTCYLCGAAISSLRHHPFQNVVNTPICYGEFCCMQNQNLKWCMAFCLHRTLADSFQLGFLLEGSCYCVCSCRAM